MKCGEEKLYKIGISKCPETRRNQLQTGNPHLIKIMFVLKIGDKYSKIKANAEIFKMNDIDDFISFLNKYSSNSTIVLATSNDIGKPGPLIDKLIYEKSSSLLCPLVIINGNLQDKEIEKIT